MLGLSGYDSSDGEEEPNGRLNAEKASEDLNNTSSTRLQEGRGLEADSYFAGEAESAASASRPIGLPSNELANGPQLGPSMPESSPNHDDQDFAAAPLLPYASTGEVVRNLTMPPVPNFDIPPSPPGSPVPGSTEKFTRFLDLKKKGVHFNEKLEKSSALRNPNLLHKLRDFAGIDGDQQYASSLPDDLAVPTVFPEWAYADELNKIQAQISKKREKDKAQQVRDSVAFVPASSTTSTSSSRNGTPGASGRSAPTSATERIMAGLDGAKGASAAAGAKRSDSSQQKSRFDPR